MKLIVFCYYTYVAMKGTSLVGLLSAKVFFMYEVHMKRQANLQLFSAGELALAQYAQALREVAKLLDVSPHDLRYRFGYRMAESVPLHRLA